jgi:threonine aldolase
MRTIDLRSDTVTHPTPEMRQAMAEAEVGDDVLGDDLTTQRLEAMGAERTGKEAALFVSSGTMGNLLAILSWCNRGDEVVLGSEAHVLWHESAGSAAIAGALLRTVPNDERGRLNPDDVEAAIRAYRSGVSPTGLVAMENTHNRCSGAALTAADTKTIADVAHKHGLPMHLDGARLFNAAVALGVPVSNLTADIDSVTFCFSKGLSAPIGSMLCGTQEFIDKARKWRKMLGGGMRQVGVIAAAATVALEQMVPRLAEDHVNAKQLTQGLVGIPGISIDPAKIETNIVIFEWQGGNHPEFMAKLADAGVKASSSGEPKTRMVTHWGINGEDIQEAIEVISAVAKDALGAKA